jgi:hypothetical protein
MTTDYLCYCGGIADTFINMKSERNYERNVFEMPRLLNVQRKRRAIMKKRQNVMFNVYLYAAA